MTYGIDDTIQQKVDAYRGNPGALQKRYTESKQLVDLLALQKMKSEQAAIARDLQMKRQKNPKTIAQQYEEELVGQTKQEMLKGVAGVMQNRQAKQQKNLQRVAQRGLPGAAARPSPKQMMAQGGIVGFSNGGTAQDKFEELQKLKDRTDIDEITKYQMIQALLGREGYEDPATLDRDAANRQAARAQRDSRQDKIGATPEGEAPTLGRTKMVDGDYKDTGKMFAATQGMQGNVVGTGASKGVGDPGYVPDAMGGIGANMLAGLGGPESSDPRDATTNQPATNQSTDNLKSAFDQLGTDIGAAPSPNTDANILDSLTTTVPTVAYKPQDPKKLAVFNELRADAKAQMAIDPQAAKTDARDEALEYLQLSEEDQAIRNRVINERKAQENEVRGIESLRYGDPAELRRQRLIQNLIGATGTTIGSTLASGAGASIRERGRQRAGIDALRGERMGLQDKRLVQEGADVTERQGFKKDALASGDVAFAQAAADVRQGRTTIANITEAELQYASNQADKILAADLGNQKTAIAERQSELRVVLQIADQAFKGNLAKYEGKVKMSLKAIDGIMAERKNSITEKYYDAIAEIQRTGNNIKLLDTIKSAEKIIGDITNNYETVFAPMITEAQQMQGNKKYKGLSSAELIKLKNEAISATISGLKDLIEQAEKMTGGGSGDDGYTVNTIS